MAQDINLLPPEFSPQKAFVEAAGKVKKVSLFIFVFLLIVIACSAVSLFLLSRQISQLSDKQETLTAQVDSLKTSEAQIIILKDRADKAKGIFDSNSTRDSLEAFKVVETNTNPGIEYTDLTLDGNLITFSVAADNSARLEEFVTYLVNSRVFQKIYLGEMSFNKSGAYDASFVTEL